MIRWAQVSPNNWSGNHVLPLSGKQDQGFLAAERPAAETLNHILGRAYEWHQYLSDGDIELNGITAPAVDAALPNGVQNIYDPTLTASLAGLYYIRLTGGGASAAIAGVILDGTVNGRVLVFHNATGQTFTLIHEEAGTPAANRIWIPGISTAMTSVSVTIPVNGTFAIRYSPTSSRWEMFSSSFPYDVAPVEVLVIPAALAHRKDIDTEQFYSTFWDPNGDNGPITYPIVLPVGAVLKSWKLYCTKTSANPASIAATLQDVDCATQIPTSVGATQSNVTTSPGAITLKDTAVATTFAVGHSYCVSVVGTAAGLEDKIGDLEVSYIRPTVRPAWSYTP